METTQPRIIALPHNEAQAVVVNLQRYNADRRGYTVIEGEALLTNIEADSHPDDLSHEAIAVIVEDEAGNVLSEYETEWSTFVQNADGTATVTFCGTYYNTPED